jgi:hypothetical protein
MAGEKKRLPKFAIASRLYTKVYQLEESGFIEKIAVIAALSLFLWSVATVVFELGLAKLYSLTAMQEFVTVIAVPFTVFLFYELFLMILYLSKSLIKAVEKQYQVMTLIVLNESFKSISAINIAGTLPSVADFTDVMVLLGVAIGMFGLSAWYRLVSRGMKDYDVEPPFFYFELRKTLSLLLMTVLMGLLSLLVWGAVTGTGIITTAQVISTVFLLMILADVALLFLSLLYTSDFAVLITNITFVLVGTLFRFGIAYVGNRYFLSLIVGSMFTGIVVLLLRRHVWKGTTDHRS